MKILFVDLEFDYGDKRRGANHIGQAGFQQSFLKLGFDLEVFYYDRYLKNIDQLQVDLIQKAKEVNPDWIFFILFTDQFDLKTLDYLKSQYPTIAWFGDDTWRFDIYSKYLATYFTWCITTDNFSIPKYHEIGQKNVILSQWAAIDSHAIPQKQSKYQHEVSFVGGTSPYRQWFFSFLRKQGIDVDAFGIGWPNGQVTSTEMNSIFMNSKINLNISNSESYDLRYYFHFPIQTRNLMSRSLKENIKPLVAKGREIKKVLTKGKGLKNFGAIKARNFEIPYFGGFQLSYYFPGIEEFFSIGEELACYGSIDEAALLIRYYLDNEDEREKIAERSHQRAVKEHGYFHRMKSIMEHIKTNSVS